MGCATLLKSKLGITVKYRFTLRHYKTGRMREFGCSQRGGHLGAHALGKYNLWLLLLLTVGLISGCTVAWTRTLTQSADSMSIQVDRFYQQYQTAYQLAPRPTGSAQAIAEAYLRRYQPGPLPRVFQHTTLYDRNGVWLADFMDEGRRRWVSIEAISPYLINATVATEDASFYTNPGIDAKRLVGALLQNAQEGGIVSGASTITMQLARQLFFEPEARFSQTLERKVNEVFLAQELTALYTKDELLEMYLNLIYFGHLAYGPEAAAQVYFGKSAATLTLAEATLIAGIPQMPGQFDLFRNFDAVKTRQRIVLNLMVERGYLTSAEADQAWATPIELADDPDRRTLKAPHFTFFVAETAQRDWANLDFRRAGFQIYTTLDLRMQELAQQIVSQTVPALRRFNLTNAALVALKPDDGGILAMVGSIDYNNQTIGGAVNVTVRLRQPGSTVKSILYAAAFDDNLISPASVIWDLPVSYQVTPIQVYRPGNYDSRFHGPVTVRTALANSYNIPAVKVLDRVGTARMRETAIDMGLTSFTVDGNYGLGMTLGSNEATLLELTSVYDTLASNGVYSPPTPYRAIIDGYGNQVALPATTPPRQAVSPEAAYLVTSILSDNVARTPAYGPNSQLNLSKPAAVKTGTSSSWRDNWTIGYTRYLVTGVWAGNNSGRPMSGVAGVTGAGPIWHDFMEGVIADPALLGVLQAPSDPAGWEFIQPATVKKLRIECPKPIQCKTDGELFSQAWLRQTGQAHVLDDSYVTGQMATVFVNRTDSTVWRVGVCAQEGGEETTALRLPNAVGLLIEQPITGTLALTARTGIEEKLAVSNAIPQLPGMLRPPRLTEPTTYFGPPAADFTIGAERLRVEQRGVLDWSYRTGTAMYLGACKDINETMQALFGRSIRGVTLQTPQNRQFVAIGPTPTATVTPAPTATPSRTPAATTTASAGERSAPPASGTPSVQQTLLATPTPTATAVPDITAIPDSFPTAVALPAAVAPTGAGTFRALGVAHDEFCSGDYILGQVLSRAGAPVAGVRIVVVDQWGNRNEVLTKNGVNDFGRYDFPIGTNTRDLYVTIVDSAGNPLSETVGIAHRRFDDLSCHHITWIEN